MYVRHTEGIHNFHKTSRKQPYQDNEVLHYPGEGFGPAGG